MSRPTLGCSAPDFVWAHLGLLVIGNLDQVGRDLDAAFAHPTAHRLRQLCPAHGIEWSHQRPHHLVRRVGFGLQMRAPGVAQEDRSQRQKGAFNRNAFDRSEVDDLPGPSIINGPSMPSGRR